LKDSALSGTGTNAVVAEIRRAAAQRILTIRETLATDGTVCGARGEILLAHKGLDGSIASTLVDDVEGIEVDEGLSVRCSDITNTISTGSDHILTEDKVGISGSEIKAVGASADNAHSGIERTTNGRKAEIVRRLSSSIGENVDTTIAGESSLVATCDRTDVVAVLEELKLKDTASSDIRVDGESLSGASINTIPQIGVHGDVNIGVAKSLDRDGVEVKSEGRSSTTSIARDTKTKGVTVDAGQLRDASGTGANSDVTDINVGISSATRRRWSKDDHIRRIIANINVRGQTIESINRRSRESVGL